jgi:hypothetical protein
VGAAIALAIAVAAACGAVLTMALKALSAERRAGEQKARADSLDVNLTSIAALLADTTKQLQDARERMDALSEMAISDAANHPTDGSFKRLLALLGVNHAKGPDGAGNSAVLHGQPTPANDPDGLLDPSSID